MVQLRGSMTVVSGLGFDQHQPAVLPVSVVSIRTKMMTYKRPAHETSKPRKPFCAEPGSISIKISESVLYSTHRWLSVSTVSRQRRDFFSSFYICEELMNDGAGNYFPPPDVERTRQRRLDGD